MYTKSEKRLFGLALAALFTTIGAEFLGSQSLVAVGVGVFALAVVALFGVMSVVLAVSVARDPDLNALEPAAADRPR
ncbi:MULTISPECIES: hypothetical protein [Halorubrum]|uniref:Uncharacterized protein n=1 Tax=Halorubrum hochstenium ATCC 700873 TaxID=1227481 RepID=M0FSK6_9EURY|nr:MULTISPECIES: hypothetical protein [Halorubrum]ELZ61534.1 hypothetical protein C467_00836 [Halorubrum hochstenium ATCC 700873]